MVRLKPATTCTLSFELTRPAGDRRTAYARHAGVRRSAAGAAEDLEHRLPSQGSCGRTPSTGAKCGPARSAASNRVRRDHRRTAAPAWRRGPANRQYEKVNCGGEKPTGLASPLSSVASVNQRLKCAAQRRDSHHVLKRNATPAVCISVKNQAKSASCQEVNSILRKTSFRLFSLKYQGS